MKSYTRFLWIFFILLFSPTAFASVSGSELLSSCNAFLQVVNKKETLKDNAMQSGMCVGYIEAIADFQDYLIIASAATAKDYKTKKRIYCPPENLTTTKATNAVVDYLKNNPAQLNLPAASGVLNAFIQAYPCK